jgi:hypothetical protein
MFEYKDNELAYNLTNDIRYCGSIPYDFRIVTVPCTDCITYPMCLNKIATDLIFCPLLDPFFYDEGHKLSDNKSIALGLTPLNIVVILQRDTRKRVFIDVYVDNDHIGYLCRRLEL